MALPVFAAFAMLTHTRLMVTMVFESQIPVPGGLGGFTWLEQGSLATNTNFTDLTDPGSR